MNLDLYVLKTMEPYYTQLYLYDVRVLNMHVYDLIFQKYALKIKRIYKFIYYHIYIIHKYENIFPFRRSD